MSGPRALSCPACGGTVGPPLTARKTICEFCGKPLFYREPGFLPRYLLPPSMSEQSLQAAARSLLRGRWLPSDLSRRALLVRRQRSYLPFYLLTGKRGGVLATGRERVVQDPGASLPRLDAAAIHGPFQRTFERQKTEVRVEEDSRVILGDFRYLYPAAALSNWDLLDVDLRDAVKESLDCAVPADIEELAGQGEVVDVDIPIERILDIGVKAVQSAAGELKVMQLQPTLLYIPVQTLTFRYGGQFYTVTVEEVGGRWVSGHLPFRRDYAVLAGLVMTAGLGFFVGQFLSVIAGAVSAGQELAQGQGRWVVVRVLAVVGVLLFSVIALGLNAAWLMIRAPLVVRLGGGGMKVDAAGPVPRSPMAPVNALLRFFVGAILGGAAKGLERWGL
ncbi:MAG: hypothetical protein WBS54_04545 [Acidobacteriota bacterium]